MNKYISLRIILVPVSILWLGTAFGQQQPSNVQLTGTILDAENGDPLSGVHIISYSKSGTTTDIDGNFLLNVSKGDTVRISHVGYNEYLVPIPSRTKQELTLTIALTPSLRELDEIVVYQWPATLSQFKQKVLTTEVEEDEKVIIPGSYRGPPKPIKPGVGSPISFLQSKLSKKIRKRQEFLKKRLELDRTKPARSRYNPEYVAEITGIDDEDELEEFMAFCQLTDGYITRVSDYDLIVTINQCYKDFQAAQ